jgi:UDP-N-acetylglucosamine transferase subunit ALG13
VAGNASQLTFIEETFGAIETIHIDGYDIQYSDLNKWAQAGLILQMPRILRTIKAEHQWLLKLCRKGAIDGIISDNRYGLYHTKIPSVILTHQLMVRTGMGNLADRTIQKLHYRFLNKFNTTWIPDVEGKPNLGGLLSHTALMPANYEYIGLLSRFGQDNKEAKPDKSIQDLPENSPALILISGPEPQRTLFSQLLWEQAIKFQSNVIFVEGSKEAIKPKTIPEHITYYKRLTGEPLKLALKNSGIVICRSGYSTLMDLVALDKKAIIIPTPGQSEQQYLATKLNQDGVFLYMQQRNFNLKKAVENAKKIPFNSTGLQQKFGDFENILNLWVATL